MPAKGGTVRRRTIAMAGGAVVAAWLAACASTAPDPQATLQRANAAMGTAQVRSLQYAATGTGGIFGQAYRPGDPWPRVTYSSFSRVHDYENGSFREDFARTRAEPNGGGALPLMGQGEQRGNGLLRGTQAWNLAGTNAVAAPLATDGRIHDLWTSPHGVLRAAQKNKATARSEGGKTLLSFTEPGRFRATAVIGENGLVERVDSVQPNPVMGDTATVTSYEDYRDHGGFKFPARIRQTQGGWPVLNLQVGQVQANAAPAIDIPATVPAFAERAVPEKVADGVWFLGGGSHNSVLVEMADHLILVESPLYDGRTQAVLAAAKQLVPNKPIRYVVNSHHHFDHAGGLRTAAADGAVLVTSELARPWFAQTFATANSISPDALARSGRTPRIEAVSGKRTFTDGTRTLEVMMIDGSVHAQGFMLAWLPRERLLVEADAFTPGPPGTSAPAQPNGNNVNLADNIERLGLNVDRILPLHGRVVPMAELRTAVRR
jgi:glyoxylase-like metal-dependent hydrolase (beta-lactamase superfamily II)